VTPVIIFKEGWTNEGIIFMEASSINITGPVCIRTAIISNPYTVPVKPDKKI